MLLLISCARPALHSRPPPAGQTAQLASSSAREERLLFDLHIGFWVNLHQRLYAESGPRPPREDPNATAAGGQEIWARAVDFYRRRYPERGLLTLLENEELVRVNRQLAALENAPTLATETLPPELRTTLEMAAPIYRSQRWPLDEQLGQELHRRLIPLLARHGPALAKALATAYATPWPERPMRVDIAAYAGPVGAYTMTEPTHITIAGNDRRHLGDAVLEILFHEASHALVQRIEDAIARACRAEGRALPASLWHAILFYATGELVRRELGSEYTPYAYKNGLYARDPQWAAAEPLLANYWPRYLDGRQTLDATIAQIVKELP